MTAANIRNLFLLYGLEIESFLARRVACRHTAADLTQELFLQLMEPPSKDHIRNVRAYLYRAAVNLAINHRARERRRETFRDGQSAAAKEHVDTITPEHVASDEDRLRAMAAALDELPPLARQVFVLTRIYGLKQSDVARQLGVHVTTVEKNLSRAVRHCYARAMEADGDSHGMLAAPRGPE